MKIKLHQLKSMIKNVLKENKLKILLNETDGTPSEAPPTRVHPETEIIKNLLMNLNYAFLSPVESERQTHSNNFLSVIEHDTDDAYMRSILRNFPTDEIKNSPIKNYLYLKRIMDDNLLKICIITGFIPRNITSLYLNDCPNVTDISPLSSLANLKELDLGKSNVTDISPLSSLTNLQKLELNGCLNITDISPLSSLVKLQELQLRNCPNVTDISPLSSLVKLQELDLSYSFKITDISPIKGLTSLKKLNLFTLEIGEFNSFINNKNLFPSSLKSLINLESLVLPRGFDNTNMKNLRPILDEKLENLLSVSY